MYDAKRSCRNDTGMDTKLASKWKVKLQIIIITHFILIPNSTFSSGRAPLTLG
jgi:hypothetical protein